MPVYEFYCSTCHAVFNFFTRSIKNKSPCCPKCNRPDLKKEISIFSTLSNTHDKNSDQNMPDLDETKMNKAMESLMKDSEKIDENDPQQAANLMRKFSDMVGVKLGPEMQDALNRIETGESPESVEKDMGDILGNENFIFSQYKTGESFKKGLPAKDEKLYEF